MDDTHPTWRRLEDQIDWYDRQSRRAQHRYKGLQVASLLAAASVPILAPWTPWQVAAIAGAAVAVMQGIQGVNQYQRNWITYRSTCEDLRHEKYLFLAQAGPYAVAHDADKLLAERVEETVSREHAKWVAARHAAATSEGGD